MKMKKAIYLISGICILCFLLLELNPLLQVSLLWNLLDKKICKSISPNEKWLGCPIRIDTRTKQSYLSVFSTRFPFRSVDIYLPDLLINRTEGYYIDTDTFSWSYSGNNFVVTTRKKQGVTNIDSPDLINGESSNKVNCIPNIRQNIGISFQWAMDEDVLLLSKKGKDQSIHFSILNKEAQLINQFEFNYSNLLHENEDVTYFNYFWNSQYIYLLLGYQEMQDQNWDTPHPQRVEVYRIQVETPEKNSLLLEETGDYDIFSVDFSKNRVLLIQNNGNGDISNQVLLFDLAGNPFRQIININLQNHIQFYENRTYNVNKSFDTITVLGTLEGTNSESLFLKWSWKNSDYVFLPPNEHVIGTNNESQTFLCEYFPFRDLKLMLIRNC